ncbi:MAG: hypothetical protein A2252_00050 [Elusimicrobia bacterium RIFOXYA2_FULL_39_19]|nr:MAG: hypothetical protein A2252_00050 [Elusimicrobia bacterium RIFOXYA2_FULL_39_19]
MSPFEIIMLVCFGVSWPVSIYKSFKTKNVSGKSAWFLWLIIVGYISGILHKIIFNMDFVIIFYALNGIFVLIDLMLYYKYSKKAVKSSD